MENPLTRKTLLLSLHISHWSGEVTDRKALSAVAKSFKGDTRRDRYTKSLFVSDVLQHIATLASRLRVHFYRHTLPWLAQGNGRIIAGVDFREFSLEHKRLRMEFDNAVDDFVTHYKEHCEEAKANKGDLYNPKEYPPQEKVREKFQVSLVALPFPDTNDIRLDIPREAYEELTASMEETLSTIGSTMSKDILERLQKHIHVFVTALTSGKRIRIATQRNVIEACELGMKFENALPLRTQSVLTQAQQLAEAFPIEELRHSESARNQVGSELLMLTETIRKLRNA